MLIAGVVCGLLGIAVAIFLQRVAIAAAGFFAGGYFAMNVATSYLGTTGTTGWVLFVIGGILGAVLLSMLFDWALIVLSSLMGAVLVAQSLHLPNSPLLMFALAVAGILVQAQLRRGPSKRKVQEE